MEFELKTNNKVSYVHAFIKHYFPMYVRFMSNSEITSLVNKIQFSSEIKMASLVDIKNGNLDDFIVDEVNKYAVANLKDVYDNFENFRLYIEILIKNKLEFKVSSILLNEISMDIALEYDVKLGYSNLMNGNYNSEYISKGLQKIDEKRKMFNHYIAELIETIEFTTDDEEMFFDESALNLFKNCDEFSSDVRRLIFDKVVLEMFENYGNNNYDNDSIKESYLAAIEFLNYDIVEHVCNVSNKMEFFELMNISIRNAARDISKMAFKGEISASRILDGKMDAFIVNYLKTLNNKALRSKNISSLADSKPKLINKPKMVDDSVVDIESTEVYKPIAYNPEKKEMNSSIAMLLVVAVLTSLLPLSVYLVKRREERNAVDTVVALDYTDNYFAKDRSDVACGIVGYYDRLVSYDKIYGNLCFFNAYISDGMTISRMDNILANVKSFISNDEYSELRYMLDDCVCFYDFMYDSLLRMGCDDVRDAKFENAIRSYKESHYGNLYGIVSDFHIHSEDKMVLEELDKLYREYCLQQQIELGKNIIDSDKTMLEIDNSRRGI